VSLWDAIVINPFTNVLLLIYALLGHNFAVAIVVLTVLIRLVTFPLTLRQQKSARAMQALQPKLQELQKKYAKDREKLNVETMKLYREAGINPFGGCLPLLLQFPIFIGLYQVVPLVMVVNPLQMLDLARHLYSLPFLTQPGTLLPLNNRFLWLNLGQPDPLYVLPVLTVVAMYWQQKVMTPFSVDPQAQALNQQMMLIMPLMFGYFVMVAPSGLGLYWLASNLIGIAQYWLANRSPMTPVRTAPWSENRPPVRSQRSSSRARRGAA